MSAEPVIVAGFGRTTRSAATMQRPRRDSDVARLLAGSEPRGVLARGLGRAYGDAAQNAGGVVLDMTGLDQLGTLDLDRLTLRVGAGARLGMIEQHLLRRGLLLPVTPGTAHVTVGGAVACDVHGKNHLSAGGFAEHVVALELESPGSGRFRLERERDQSAFNATTGGLGLTGVIVEATLRVRRVETAWMHVRHERCARAEALLASLAEAARHAAYANAWIDLTVGGRSLGRGIVSSADHAALDQLPAAARRRPLAEPTARPCLPIPSWLALARLGRGAIRAINAASWAAAARGSESRLVPLTRALHPFDALPGWVGLYGPAGVVQYQAAIPDGGEAALLSLLERVAEGPVAPCIAALKRLGPSAGQLSFPLPGWSIAMDFPAAARGLASLLDALDELVAGAHGRVYLAKDARLRSDHMPAMYPKLAEWRSERDRLDPQRRICSDLARRLRLLG